MGLGCRGGAENATLSSKRSLLGDDEGGALGTSGSPNDSHF